MPGPTPQQHRSRATLFVYRNTVWISEPLAATLVGLLLVFLISISAVIIFNSYSIRKGDKRIALLRAETIKDAHALETLRKEERILALLRDLARTKTADRTRCEVARLVCRNSDQYGYDPLLLLAVIHVEGVFNPGALGRFRSGNPSGAMGLMQLKLETAREVAAQLGMQAPKEKDLFNPETNLVLGVAYLTQLISRFKGFKLGLLAYNQGPGAVRSTLSNEEPLSISYYHKVLRSYFLLKKRAAIIDGKND